MGKTATYYLFLLLCLLVYNCVGDYRLEIKVERYQNPLHTLANGDCCYRWSRFRGACTTSCHSQFLFCVSSFQNEIEENNLCGSQRNYTTFAIGGYVKDGDDLSFERDEFIDGGNNVPNPLVFTGNGSWPGRFQFRTRVTNYKYFYEDVQLVDVIVEDWEMPVGLPFSRRRITGRSGHTLIRVSGQVLCVNGLLCKNCTESCDKTQDEGASNGDGNVRKDEEGDEREDDGREGESEEGDGEDDSQEENNEEQQEENDADETEPSTSTTPATTAETEAPESNVAFLNASSSESSGLLRDELVIGLSVAGIVVVSVVLAIVLLGAYGFVRRRMKHTEIRRSEQQPFLRSNRQVGNSRYRAAATDDDSQDETVPPMDNPTYDGPSNIYSAPPAPLYAVPRKPRKPRVIRTETSSSGGTSSSADDERDHTHTDEDYASQYAIITRHNGGSISPAQSLDDIPEASVEEEQEAEMAGYNVITHENMDGYVSEASASEDDLGERVGDAEASQDRDDRLTSSGVTGDVSESRHIAEPAEPPI